MLKTVVNRTRIEKEKTIVNRKRIEKEKTIVDRKRTDTTSIHAVHNFMLTRNLAD